MSIGAEKLEETLLSSQAMFGFHSRLAPWQYSVPSYVIVTTLSTPPQRKLQNELSTSTPVLKKGSLGTLKKIKIISTNLTVLERSAYPVYRTCRFPA